uniref:Uncharacterized protein n=1 Tax=Arion vulgaris TaxID=1028688 RepID=A0A0B6YFD8_9EUPU
MLRLFDLKKCYKKLPYLASYEKIKTTMKEQYNVETKSPHTQRIDITNISTNYNKMRYHL